MAGVITIRAEDGSFSVRCLECGRVKIYRRGETDCMKCGKDLDLDPLLPTTEEAARSMPDARDARIAELEAERDAAVKRAEEAEAKLNRLFSDLVKADDRALAAEQREAAALDAPQHGGQALREVRAEAVDNYREMVCAVAHEEILWLPANPHRQPQADDKGGSDDG